MGVHDGHRHRTLEKFSKNGFTGLEEHQKLEIILFFSVPRIDTNEIAHLLLNKYRNIAGVMDAPAEELKMFPGITDRTVQLFKMIKETYSLYCLEKNNDKTFLTVAEEFGTYFQLYFAPIDEEKLAVMSLDSRGKIIGVDIVGEGDISSVAINPRKILETVIKRKASEVVFCHNHPGNIPFPSNTDIEVTKVLGDYMKSLGVFMKDHIIVTKDDYISMASDPLYNHLFK